MFCIARGAAARNIGSLETTLRNRDQAHRGETGDHIPTRNGDGSIPTQHVCSILARRSIFGTPFYSWNMFLNAHVCETSFPVGTLTSFYFRFSVQFWLSGLNNSNPESVGATPESFWVQIVLQVVTSTLHRSTTQVVKSPSRQVANSSGRQVVKSSRRQV